MTFQLTYRIACLATYLLDYSLTDLLICLLNYWLNDLSTYRLTDSLTYLFVYLSNYSQKVFSEHFSCRVSRKALSFRVRGSKPVTATCVCVSFLCLCLFGVVCFVCVVFMRWSVLCLHLLCLQLCVYHHRP